MQLVITLSLALLSAAIIPAHCNQFLSPKDRPAPSDIGDLDYVEIVGAAYSASAGAVYVTSKASEAADGALPDFRTDAYTLSGERVWVFAGGESAPAVRASDGVIAMFANDYQRILLGADGVELERGYLTVEGDDPSQNAPVWLPDGRLSFVANRAVDGGNFSPTRNMAPRVWPGGEILTDDTSTFALVSRGGEGGEGSIEGTKLMTTLVPAPVEGQPGRVVFGWTEFFPQGDAGQGGWVLAMDVDRSVITAALPLGTGFGFSVPSDVVVGPDGKIYVSATARGNIDGVTVYRISADLSAVEWTQTFSATPSGEEGGMDFSGLALIGDRLALVTGLVARNSGQSAVPAPTFSISGGGADPSVALSMLIDTIPPTISDFQTRQTSEPPLLADLLLLVLDPETGALSEEPRVVGTEGIDLLSVFDSRGGRGAVLNIGNDDMLAIVGNFGSTRASLTASNDLFVPLRDGGEASSPGNEEEVDCA